MTTDDVQNIAIILIAVAAIVNSIAAVINARSIRRR